MKSLKQTIWLCLVAALFLALAGCGSGDTQSQYHIEFINKEKTKLVPVAYEPLAADTAGMVEEFLSVLGRESENVDYVKPMPGDVKIVSHSLDGAMLTLHFNSEYSKMPAAEEVLCRAAIVRTMTQIEGVDCVSFYIGDVPLADGSGEIVGIMNQESFIENPGEQINSLQNATLTLYFANETGDGLVKEVREDVYYSSNISLEKLVMEQLLEGPKSENAYAAIPAGTRLVTASVVDGVCFVSLDQNFKNQNYKVSEGTVIYSIVDSLTELPTISKVQISINGDTNGVYRDTYKLATMYERNVDCIRDQEETVHETQTEGT